MHRAIDSDKAKIHGRLLTTKLTNNEVMLFQHYIGDEWNEIECLVFAAIEFDDDDQQVGPREDGALANGSMRPEDRSLDVDRVITHS